MRPAVIALCCWSVFLAGSAWRVTGMAYGIPVPPGLAMVSDLAFPGGLLAYDRAMGHRLAFRTGRPRVFALVLLVLVGVMVGAVVAARESGLSTRWMDLAGTCVAMAGAVWMLALLLRRMRAGFAPGNGGSMTAASTDPPE